MTKARGRSPVAALSVAVLSACRLSGQAVPGLDGRLLSPGTDTMRITAVRAGEEHHRGRAISSVRLLPGEELELLYTYEVPDEVRAVRTRLRRGDLSPIEEIHDFGSGDTVVVRFGPRGAAAERRRGGSTEPYEPDPDARGAFTSAAVDLVLRALPLRDGYRAELPVYFMALNETVRLPVRVAGSDALRTRNGALVECWRVEGEFPGGAVEQFWIAKRSRELIRVVGHTSPDAIERYER